MQTPQEQAAFFESHKASLIERARQGVDAAVSFIESFEDPLEQRVLWFYSRQALMLDAAAGVDLDTCIGVAQASIRSFLALAETEHDPEQRARRTDMANILSYNLSADLADCWDPDGRERTAAHFEVGLAAALDCIRWREELNKPAGPHSMAWWARGMHELSLGRHAESVASFERSLDFAKEASPEDAESFGILLGMGYLAIARAAGGDGDAQQLFDEARALFDKQASAKGDEAIQRRAEDAKFGLSQLQTVRDRYWPNS